MSEKIQSMSNKVVRFKREHIRSYTDWVHPYDDEGDMVLDKQEERTIYEILDDNGRIIYDDIENPVDDLFDVTLDFYGVDIRSYTQGAKPYEVDTNDVKHLLRIKPRGSMTAELYFFYEAKYLEVVKPETIWVRDENFYKNKYMGCDSEYV
jgi:hypothetical protein